MIQNFKNVQRFSVSDSFINSICLESNIQIYKILSYGWIFFLTNDCLLLESCQLYMIVMYKASAMHKKSAGCCGFGHIYWRNPQCKTSLCMFCAVATVVKLDQIYQACFFSSSLWNQQNFRSGYLWLRLNIIFRLYIVTK